MFSKVRFVDLFIFEFSGRIVLIFSGLFSKSFWLISILGINSNIFSLYESKRGIFEFESKNLFKLFSSSIIEK